MKKIISTMLILAHLLLIVGPSYTDQSDEMMQVLKIIDNVLSANKGADDGISTGERFYIVRKNETDYTKIGKAKVISVKERLCALELIEVSTDLYIQSGDFLLKDNEFTESDIIIEEIKTENMEHEQSADQNNYYIEGINLASNDYNSSGAFFGGLLSGFGLGFIGWGLGYLYIANKGINVPESYSREISPQQKHDLNSGYKDKISSKRKTAFNIGALIGVIGAVIVVTNAQD